MAQLSVGRWVFGTEGANASGSACYSLASRDESASAGSCLYWKVCDG